VIGTAGSLRGRVLAIGSLVTLGALVALGCGGEKQEAPPAPAPAPDVTAEQPTEPKAADQVWLNSLPEDFPADVPRYPSADVVKALSTPESGLKATFSTSDEPGKVAAYFNDNLAAQGWSTQRVDAADGILVLGDKGGRSATVGISAGEGKTKIELFVVEMR